jgi:hypothetical protein
MSRISAPTAIKHVISGKNSPLAKIHEKSHKSINWKTATVAQQCDAVFEAFIEEFRAQGWKYAAGGLPVNSRELMSGAKTTSQLEAEYPGVGASLHCGKIRDLLKITFDFTVDAKLTYACEDHNGFFVTKKLGSPPPGVLGVFKCIDPRIIGNVKTAIESYARVSQCLFIDHMALRVNEAGKVYDPCLMCTYQSINSVIAMKLEAKGGNRDNLGPIGMVGKPVVIGAQRGPVMAGHRTGAQQVRYVKNNDRPQGFTCGYTLSSAS